MAIPTGIPKRTRLTGLDLRLRRTEAGVSQTRLAATLGVSRRRVGNIEAMYRPPASAARRYLEALGLVVGE